MLQTKKLVIYPTSRAARTRAQKELLLDGLIPKITTIGEFEKKAIVVKNRQFIDQDRRTLLLNEASSFETFKNLHIQREFFAFLKNSKFLFSFFDELSVELIEIEELELYDTYASYFEHIEILKTLLTKYKQLLDEKNLVDKITLPSHYKINSAYIKSFEEIELHLEGYLNNFEFKLFNEIAKIVPLKIYIFVNEFNKKMIEKFQTLGIELNIGKSYIINLSTKSIESSNKQTNQSINIDTKPLKSEILQVAYVKKRVYDYYKLGIAPQNIAIILPNANFAKLLDLFDDENNYNFAMGFSYTKTKTYQKLLAKYDYYNEKSFENRYRLKRLYIDVEKLDKEQKNWNKKLSSNELNIIFLSFINVPDDDEEEETQIFTEELYIFSKLFKSLENQPFHKIFHLFLNRLATRTLDDIRGGKVTVLEILETRGVSYEGVIVVDFNEGVVPKSSSKDLFLSSELRVLASLPTTSDRENLQKYYYKRVFESAKYLSICYIENEKNQPSRFLDELQIKKNINTLAPLESILFNSHKTKPHYEQSELIHSWDFTKIKLSSTALKTFLDCKRMYYFKYIKKLPEVEIPKDDNSDKIIGILLHNALKYAYEKNSIYLNEDELRFEIQSYLYKESEQSQSLRFLVDLWLKNLEPFIKEEIKRANNGYKIKYIEKSFNLKIDTFTLTGVIDRVDEKDGYLEVIDYKSGKIPMTSKKSIGKSTNFQLQFYHLLASKGAEVKESYFYDLNSGKLISEDFFDQKLDLLYKKLEQLNEKEHNFTMTDDMKKCIFCPYIKICNRLL